MKDKEKNENKFYDPELDELLGTYQADKMAEVRAADSVDEQIKHLHAIKEAAEIRKDISCVEPTCKEETKWLDRQTNNRQFIKDCFGMLAVPLFGLLGVCIGNGIQTKSNERIARMQVDARSEQLKQLMHYEENDTISKHELEVLNQLNK